ncbi:MAG: YmdB family metallophosphoesterase [Oscillospiraceae bacterium]|nr:YmdB family metallophosphoesterase [Oscillospiraceae bacterium]
MKVIKVLFVGDVQGQTNVSKLAKVIPQMRNSENLDCVIINGENSADGNGITPKSANMLFNDVGADVITTGNHAFKRKEMDTMFNERQEVIRPANYGEPLGYCPGRGVCILDFGHCQLAVINIMGASYMPPCDNPFKCIDELLTDISTPNIIVDFHAESTAEKKAMGFYLSQRVSAVFGTHTHVQTADERILDNHTAFISDVGMVGATDSVIGAQKQAAIDKLIGYYPQKYKFADGETEFNAVIVKIDASNGCTTSLKRINYKI